jgi:hypothetical protein
LCTSAYFQLGLKFARFVLHERLGEKSGYARAMLEESRLGPRSLAVLVMLVVGTLLACKKKKAPDPTPVASAPVAPENVKGKELAPKNKQFIEQVEAMAKKAAKEPPVRRDKPFKTKLEKGKFVIVGSKWMTNPHADVADDELELKPTVLSLCTYDKDKTEIALNDLKYAEECLGWEYIAVVRQKSLSMPKVKMATKTFDPGSFIGDMLLFEVLSGEIKGRYQMSITNSDKLTYLENRSEDDWHSVAKRDLLENVTGVIEERLQLERDSMTH